MRAEVERFCAEIGGDALLVQGAGGNASWKDGDTLWVKASGTWLEEACRRDIFVPVDLMHLNSAIAVGDFDVTPRAAGPSSLRPSIETLLHALMPHPVVIHLHAVEILTHLVRAEFPANLNRLLDDSDLHWVDVAYCKPGADLARAISAQLSRNPGAEIVMMQNHGVVIGGRDLERVRFMLAQLTLKMRTPPRSPAASQSRALPAPLSAGYAPAADDAIHQLAMDDFFYHRLESDWALYPDHVVFLGGRPACFEGAESFMAANPDPAGWPELLFLRGMGVYARLGLTQAKLVQLRCYYDVLARQPGGQALRSLSLAQIESLLDWDAEKYRMALSR
jgi:rhamnose utilization protein RhaD (predicted bifunctional aldolase and dehydrogenase)